jgi:hypothetical protein
LNSPNSWALKKIGNTSWRNVGSGVLPSDYYQKRTTSNAFAKS